MAFVASIDIGINKDSNQLADICYLLRRGVRARREKFGILFYDSRDTKLTFVRSGRCLDLATSSDGARMLVLGLRTGERAEKIESLLNRLLEKGLIFEKPTCL